jgi:hypothetical protein
MSGALGGASAEAMTAKTELAAAAAQAVLIAEAMVGAHKATSTVANDAEKADKGLGKVAKTAQSLGKNLLQSGKNLISSFGPAALAALGIGAIGSGFGIVGLADSALARWKTAAGLGMTPGQLASYQVYGQQFLGAGALQGAANAQNDLSKAGQLAVLGISQDQATGETAAALAFQELMAARKAWEGAAPGTQMQQPAVQAALALGIGADEIRRASSPDVTTAQLKATADAVAKNAHEFDLLAAAWIPLKIQIDAVGLSLESNITNALARADLPQALTALSKDFEGVINSLINSGGFSWALNEVGKAATWLAGQLTPQNLQSDLGNLQKAFHDVDWQKVGADVKLMGSEIAAVAEKLAWLIPKPADPNAPNPLKPADWGKTPGMQALKDAQKWVGEHDKGPFGLLGTGVEALGAAAGGALSAAWKWMNTPLTQNAGAAVLKVAHQAGVDPVLALAAAKQESGLNPNSQGDWTMPNGKLVPAGTKGSRPTSFGLFQLHEGGELGNMSARQAFDPIANAKIALAEFAKVAKAHPDWSPGQIAAAAQRPANPVEYAAEVNAIYRDIEAGVKHATDSTPKHDSDSKTKHAVDPMTKHTDRLIKAIKTKSRAKPTHVSISNSTASHVAVSLQAAAAGAF